LRLQGFIVSDHFSEMNDYVAHVRQWIKHGKIKWCETIAVGIERAPAELLKLFTGEHFGKMIVKLA